MEWRASFSTTPDTAKEDTSMATKANNAVLIQQLIRKANKAGWSVVRQGKSYPATKCIGCGAPTALLFERNGVRKDRCFRCSK
jgi:hypothetical protein